MFKYNLFHQNLVLNYLNLFHQTYTNTHTIVEHCHLHLFRRRLLAHNSRALLSPPPRVASRPCLSSPSPPRSSAPPSPPLAAVSPGPQQSSAAVSTSSCGLECQSPPRALSLGTCGGLQLCRFPDHPGPPPHRLALIAPLPVRATPLAVQQAAAASCRWPRDVVVCV
jgi:hypothetical protein